MPFSRPLYKEKREKRRFNPPSPLLLFSWTYNIRRHTHTTKLHTQVKTQVTDSEPAASQKLLLLLSLIQQYNRTSFPRLLLLRRRRRYMFLWTEWRYIGSRRFSESESKQTRVKKSLYQKTTCDSFSLSIYIFFLLSNAAPAPAVSSSSTESCVLSLKLNEFYWLYVSQSRC